MAQIAKKTKRYPSDLTNEEWDRLAPLMPRPGRRAHLVEGFGLAGIFLMGGEAIDELVPSTGLLLRQICLRKLVQVVVSAFRTASMRPKTSKLASGVCRRSTY